MKNIFLLFGLAICLTSFGQEKTSELNKVLRINALSPGVEIELPIFKRSTIAANAGLGIQGSYRNMDNTGSGVTYFIAPFLDLSYKNLYNRDKRASKGKSTDYNSGNYWGVRLLTHFKEVSAKNIMRNDNTSFAFGPTWGIQRGYGKFHFQLDLGPVIYFNTQGDIGFFPLAPQLNIGFNALKW